jgi:hypothetical protein
MITEFPRASRSGAPREVVAPSWIPWAVVALILAPVLVLTRADPDLWGHLRFGLDMLARHTLSSVDPYSFTQDVPWVNHEWLSELFMGAAYSIGGTAGLSILKGTLVAVLLAMLLQLYAPAAPPAIGAVIVLLALGIGRQAMTLRPQLWTLIGVAVLCRLFISGPRQWWLIAVPSLFLLWVNFHGGWIVGAGLLAIWTAFQMLQPEAPRPFIVAIAVLSAIATLANPYGWRMWAFLASTVRMTRDISEWQPLVSVPMLAWVPWFAVVSGAFLLTVGNPRPRIDRLAMVVLLAYGAFRVERLSGLFVVGAVVLMNPTVIARWPGRSWSFDPLTRNAARGLGVAMALLVAVSGVAIAHESSCIPIAGDWIPDRVAGRALAATATRGRIVTYFDWGEYALWQFGPRLRVSTDGRRETIYSDDTLARQDALEAATPDGLVYLKQLDPMYIWLPARLTKLRDWLPSHDYRLDLQTENSFVAVRADQPVLKVPPTRVDQCFPGP